MPTREELIKKLDLEKHPEGGYFKETYRSDLSISKSNLPAEFDSERSVCTSIYFFVDFRGIFSFS